MQTLIDPQWNGNIRFTTSPAQATARNFNRSLVEWKHAVVLSVLPGAGVSLIDPQWNGNFTDDIVGRIIEISLIDPQWNGNEWAKPPWSAVWHGFNRSLVEWKHCYFAEQVGDLNAFNRSLVEWKQLGIQRRIFQVASFNRSLVEWKQVMFCPRRVVSSRFNRSLVEWKPTFAARSGFRPDLL